MNLDLLICVLALLATVNYRFRRSVLYPPFLFCGMWLVVTVLLRMNIVEMYPLHTITFNCVAAGAILFSAGGYASFIVPRRLIALRFTLVQSSQRHSVSLEPHRRPSKWTERLIIVVLLGVVTAEARISIHNLSQVNTANAAMQADAPSAGAGLLMEMIDVPMFAVYFAVLFLQERRGRMTWVIISIVLIDCILRGGRGALMILFAALIGVYLLQHNKERFGAALKSVRWPIAAFFVLFAALMIIEKDTSNVTKNIIAFAGDATLQYILGPLGGLDHFLMHPADYAGMPNHTFKLFLKGASSLGLISYIPPPQLDEWTFVPFGTNVYTAYKPFISDFGLYAALAIFALIGFVHTLLFRRAKLGGRFAVYMFALTIYPIIMVVFDDVYTAFLIYIKGLFFALLYLTVRRVRLMTPSNQVEHSLKRVDIQKRSIFANLR